MSLDSIEMRLDALSVEPGGELERAIGAARETAGEIRTRARRRRLVPALIALAVLATLLAATPQGRSVADAAAELVGIGDEPSQRYPLFDDATEDANVIAVGTSPNGVRYELVATTLTDKRSEGAETCYYLSYPGLGRPSAGASCLTRDALRGLERSPVHPSPAIGPVELGADSDLVITGSAVGEVGSVTVDYRDEDGEMQRVDATVGAVDAGSTSRSSDDVGSTTPVTLFVAFLPSTILGDPVPNPQPDPPPGRRQPYVLDSKAVQSAFDHIVVTGYDSDGEEVGAHRYGDDPEVAFLSSYPDGRFQLSDPTP